MTDNSPPWWGEGQAHSPVWMLSTHLATSNAHATVVELEFVQGEAGWALEEGLEASHSIRPKGIVAEVEFHQLRSCSDEPLP